MISRRTFMGTLSAGTVSAGTMATGALSAQAGDAPADGAGEQPRRRKLTVVTTEWRDRSHAWHMAERFLAGYPIEGKWHQPPFEVVSAYVDQVPDNDLSRDRAREFGFRIYPSIAEALRCGGNTLAVDAVLSIGEHGDYPRNKIGQKMYPRYRFFRDITNVFRKDGRSVPVFNDKHLSYDWNRAKEMVETAQKLGFAFIAGSSLPATYRMPSIDLPHGAEVEEILGMAIGRVDSYDFHILEAMQCMAERRRGGERGVVSMQALRGNAVWKAMANGNWARGGWDPALFESCLCRTQTLAQPPACSHRHPTEQQIRTWVKDPVAYRFEYADGLKATMLLMNGLVGDFTVAVKLKNQQDPLSTLFYLPPTPNVMYSAALMSKVEETFVRGRSPQPIERTLLTTGLVEAAMRSLAANGRRLDTPHLNMRYQVARPSLFWQT